MGSPSASPNLGSSPGSGSPSIDTFKRRSLHYTDSFSAAASSTGQRPWMRFFQQRRTQRENQINHKIDEKQKQLAELHSQPESATGHAVVVFQLQEERNRFVSLFKGKLETSKKKRRMHLLNKVFVAAKMPPFSFRLSSRSELTSILEDSGPPPESSRLSEGTLRRVG